MRTISVRYVPVGLGLDEVKLELEKYGKVLDCSRVELTVTGG